MENLFGLVCIVVLYCLCVVNGNYMKYKTDGVTVENKLNVHLVPHSHDDVGWLKTVDQYYAGLNNSIQLSSVESVLDSVVMSLRRDPSRKFVFAEMAFFDKWWRKQNPEVQEEARNLIENGQLEFVNGGWCMHDEAAAYYIDMIDQTTLGHRLIKKLFNKTPRAGWQIDPFGHSAVQAYLLGDQLGFDSLHISRIDYQDREKRKNDKSLEVIWRGSNTFGSSSQLFTNVFPVNYSPPPGFHFEVSDMYDPVQDDPLVSNFNVQDWVEKFVTAALSQANITRSNHIMWTMGDDFQYIYAESWFKQMDKLINYVNKDGRINALYSTPSIYTDAKNAANISWPLKAEDFFPYADKANAYWTGYFTSRPAFKRYVRMLSGYYLAARQIELLMGRRSMGPNTYSLGDALGIAQHHDAISGTAQQHTTNDYAKRLAIGASEAESLINTAFSCLVNSKDKEKCNPVTEATFSQCQLLNISYCPPTEENIPQDKSLVVLVYNSLGWNRSDIVRVPVNDMHLIVQDSMGKSVESQYVEIDNVTSNLRSFYVEAYTGISPKQAPKYWLYFTVSVPPLGWNTYFITKGPQETRLHSSIRDIIPVEIGQGNLKMQFSSLTGQLTRMSNTKTGVDVPIQQSYNWYRSSEGNASDPQCSGAYIFRPENSSSVVVKQSVLLKVIRGPLFDEVYQSFGSWIHQVIRVYRDKEHAEVEYTIGPIPASDQVGKEVVTKLTAKYMATNKVFYTDSNGRDFLQRVRNQRADWNLSVTQPIAGNYYPITLGTYIEDKTTELSVLVDRAVGGSSINDGEIELMLHRRIDFDDGKGVSEPLDEQVCVNDACQRLTIRGKYYININKLGSGTRWRRTTGQQIYSPLLLAFTHENPNNWKVSKLTSATSMDPNYSLPQNVALITLQELEDSSVLLRLAHLYEANEDAEYSTLAKVELGRMFAGKTIKMLKETSLSANQEKSEMKKMTWKVEGDTGNEAKPVKGGPVSMSTLIVELGPMEIRTFLLNF